MRVMVYADIHLSTRNRAKHVSYADESLYYFEYLTEQAETLNVDAIIGLGDLSYGNFSNLKFRSIVEELLDRQYRQTKGKRYELLGNHDISAAGYSEYDFYRERGKLKIPERIEGNHVVIDVLNYGEPSLYTVEGGKQISQDKEKHHIVLCHDFLRFRESKITGYGDAYIIEDLIGFQGADWIVGGHIHDMLSDRGIVYGGNACNLFYPGAMPRPVTKGDAMEKAAYLVIDTDAEEDYVSIYEVELLPIDVSYDLNRIGKAKSNKLRNQELLEATQELRTAVRNFVPNGVKRTAYELIQSNTQVSIEVRDKALEYMRSVGNYKD